MKSVLKKHTQTVRMIMSHLCLMCSDPDFSTDNYGCRVYFPLCYYNLPSAAAATPSCYDFMWKVFDVSYNWKDDPIDIIKEDQLYYIGEQESVKEFGIN
jgi:hypothetical protein